MGKSISDRLGESKKWLKKNDEAALNLKPAQAALALAIKSNDELDKLKSRIKEASETRKAAMSALTEAIRKTKAEKKLRAKEERLQGKLSALNSAPAE